MPHSVKVDPNVYFCFVDFVGFISGKVLNVYSGMFISPQPSSTTVSFHGSCGVLSVE